VTLALLLVLLVAAILVLLPSEQATALRGLELLDDYDGPPAIIAASTDNGLVMVHLTASNADVVAYLPNIYSPRQLQFSPDGRWLAFQQGRTLYVLDAERGGASTRFAVQDSAEWAWSPDARWLAYTDGAGQLGVFDTQGAISRVLVPTSESAWGPPVWTADSQQIAYAVVKPLPTIESVQVRQSLWRASVDTGYRIELAHSPASDDTLLLPAAWDSTATTLLAWDMRAASAGQPPALYRVDVSAHSVERLDGCSVAQGTRLAWPVSSLGTLLLAQDDTSVMIAQLAETMTETPLTVPIPWPQSLEWAPNGAWFAYTTAGAAEGEGVYLFALEDSSLRPVKLPPGAAEKDVLWAGAEHLFVIRQPQGASISELWMVPLTGSEPPQRIMTNLRLPITGPYHGWRWRDILAAQVIGP
jgi:dipeptidyl aminopeptidase/acylaminoacyl peptidase